MTTKKGDIMMQEKEYTLCGGTFLTLLIKAGKLQILLENNANKYIRLNQKNLFLELIRTAFPGYIPPDDSMKTFTSDYKNCKYNHSVGLNFYDDKDGIAKFDDAIKGNYTEPLERMKNFSNTYIDEKLTGSLIIFQSFVPEVTETRNLNLQGYCLIDTLTI